MLLIFTNKLAGGVNEKQRIVWSYKTPKKSLDLSFERGGAREEVKGVTKEGEIGWAAGIRVGLGFN